MADTTGNDGSDISLEAQAKYDFQKKVLSDNKEIKMVSHFYDRFGPIRITVRLQASSISDDVWAIASQTQNDLS